MTNDLLPEYDRQHAAGYWPAHSKGAQLSETTAVILEEVEWFAETNDRCFRVLEVGFGTGDLAFALASQGFEVVAVDFSEEAVKNASEAHRHRSLTFLRGTFEDISLLGEFDIVISAGTVEHTDSPAETVKRLHAVTRPSGLCLITCPHFTNLRGAIWMTLHLVGGVMSKTDRHFITPQQMKTYANDAGFDVSNWSSRWTSFDHSWANGALCVDDMLDRVPNACRDGGLELKHRAEWEEWLRGTLKEEIQASGATALYQLRRTK